MSKIKARALQPIVDYKTGIHYEAGQTVELERGEYEIMVALAQGLYEVISEEEDKTIAGEEDGKVFSDRADA